MHVHFTTHTHTHTHSQTMATVSSPGTYNASPSGGDGAVGPMGVQMRPGAGKASILKSAYLNQYKMRFTQASTLSSSTSTISSNPLDSDKPPPTKKRKSRWD